MSNPVLVQWFRDMEDEIVRTYDSAKLDDEATRRRCMDLLTWLRKLKWSLEKYVEDGEYALKSLRDLMESKQRQGLLGRMFNG